MKKLIGEGSKWNRVKFVLTIYFTYYAIITWQLKNSRKRRGGFISNETQFCNLSDLLVSINWRLSIDVVFLDWYSFVTSHFANMILTHFN